MEQQISQNASSSAFKSDKKVRLGTGMGFRNTSQLQRTLSKNTIGQNEQNLANGVQGSSITNQMQQQQQQSQQSQQNNQQMFSSTSNNYFVGSTGHINNLIQAQQNQVVESPRNLQSATSQTQNGFFRRKINLKMSTTNLKAFLNKQPSDNPLMIKSSKNRFIGTHLSQGSIQNYNNNNLPLQQQQQQQQPQQGNFFSSQVSLPCPSIANSSNTHSPQTYNSVLNNTNGANLSQTFQSAVNSLHNSSNIDSRRSTHQSANEQIAKYPQSAFKQQQLQQSQHGEIVSAAFNRGKRFSYTSSKNVSIMKSSNPGSNDDHEKMAIQKKGSQENSDDLQEENQDYDDKIEEGNAQRNHSMTKNTIANYSHNTESTNATAQISHHNNLQMSHHYFDTDKIKKKQYLVSSQSLIPSSATSQTQINVPPSTLYVKKKLTEAKQYSNQVRQQMFFKQDQEEEENFLELCETLQKINYD